MHSLDKLLPFLYIICTLNVGRRQRAGAARRYRWDASKRVCHILLEASIELLKRGADLIDTLPAQPI